MKKEIIVLSLLSCFNFQAFAGSSNFTCALTLRGLDGDDIGDKIDVSVLGNDSITIEGGDSLNKMTGKLDSTYRPREPHEGSVRYNFADGCSYAIFDKAMSDGKNGILTFELTCDADGGPPTFERYSCEE